MASNSGAADQPPPSSDIGTFSRPAMAMSGTVSLPPQQIVYSASSPEDTIEVKKVSTKPNGERPPGMTMRKTLDSFDNRNTSLHTIASGEHPQTKNMRKTLEMYYARPEVDGKNEPPTEAQNNNDIVTNESDGSEKSDQMTTDQSDESVEEYEFKGEDYYNEDEDEEQDWDEDEDEDDAEDENNDAHSVITVSSGDSQHEVTLLPKRPWKHFTPEIRKEWELMYFHVTDHAMGGDWDATEEYQLQKDYEMIRYLVDFPLPQWVISQEQAHQAYYRLTERFRWRSLGIRIYGPDTVSGSMPGSGNYFSAGHPPNMPQNNTQPPKMGQMPQAWSVPGPMPSDDPSQRSSQPVPPEFHPSNTSQQIGPRQHMPNLGPPGPHSSAPFAQSAKSRKGKEKKQPEISAKAPPTPPYHSKAKQAGMKVTNKSARRNGRKQAEADDLPWARDMDFKEARANATWDDSIYDPKTLAAMEAVRTHNAAVITQLDGKIAEQQRIARLTKKDNQKNADSSELETERRKGGRKKSKAKDKTESGTADPYHSGQFSFATPEDEARAAKLDKTTPDEVIEATEAGIIPSDSAAKIFICWNPGKKVMTRDLQQVRFAVRDTVITRHQLANTPILTPRAAECIIDFCPNLLWHGTLLRILSEAGWGNKDVRDRFCRNGCYCDKATITKRVSSALGQKQQQTPSLPEPAADVQSPTLEDLSAYDENVKAFGHYIDFFGKRPGHHRSMSKPSTAGMGLNRRLSRQRTSGNVRVPSTYSSDDELLVVKKRPQFTSTLAPVNSTDLISDDEPLVTKKNPKLKLKLKLKLKESLPLTDDNPTDVLPVHGRAGRTNAVSLHDSDILDETDEEDDD